MSVISSHSYKRDPLTGALINTDQVGYQNARLRKNHVKTLLQERSENLDEMNQLKERLERLEAHLGK